MSGKEQKYQILFEIFLFSCLGCFSTFFLINSTEVPSKFQETITLPQAYAAVIFLFNGVGLSMTYLDRKIRRFYPSFIVDKRKMILFLTLSAILFLLLNYLLFVATKIIVDVKPPFSISLLGLKRLLWVWAAEMMIFGLLMLTNFYRGLVEMHRKTAELEENALRAQYQALQNQLKPHFLFNCLNTLISEIEYDPKNAVEFTRNLSDVYRYILQCNDKKVVSLREEFDFVQSYLFLHSVRIGNGISIENRIGDAHKDDLLPPLTLQLLVENIIKHNIISRSKPMTVNMYIDEAEKMLCLSNVKNPKKDVPSSGKGLKNLSQRYKLLCGRDIVIEDGDKCFTVKVPLLDE